MSNAVTADELLDFIELFRQLDLALAGKPTLTALGAAMNVHLKHDYGDHFVSVTIRRDTLDGKWEVVLDAWSFHLGPDDAVEKHELFGRACGAVVSAKAIVDRNPLDSKQIAERQDALRTYVTAANLETSLKGAQLAEYVIEGLTARADRERDDARRLPSSEDTPKKRFASTHV